MRLGPATRLARKMLNLLWAQFTQRAAMHKTNQGHEIIMSPLTPIQTGEVTTELKASLESSQFELKEAPDIPQETLHLRHHMTSVGRIYQVSGAGSADGHYCSFCYDSCGKFVRVHRYANHWKCCVCEAVFCD